MRITLCLSARCTLTYAPSGSATSSLQGSPHYRLRPAATLRSLTGLPLYWDAISPVGRTAQWRGGQHDGGQGQRSGAQAGACARSLCGRVPPHWEAGVGTAHQTPPGVPPPPHTALRFVRPFPPVLKRPGTVHDGGLRRRVLRAKGGQWPGEPPSCIQVQTPYGLWLGLLREMPPPPCRCSCFVLCYMHPLLHSLPPFQ